MQSQIVKRAYATPARCVSPFKVSASGDAVPEGNPRDQSVRLQIACTCGAGDLSILGFPMAAPSSPKTSIFAAPLSIACHACNKTERVFSPDCDGYDGEIGSSAGVVGSGAPSKFPCPKCGQTTFHAAVALEYSIRDEEMEDEEELAARPQDFFTGFSLFGKCTRCGHLARVTDYECA